MLERVVPGLVKVWKFRGPGHISTGLEMLWNDAEALKSYGMIQRP